MVDIAPEIVTIDVDLSKEDVATATVPTSDDALEYLLKESGDGL
jgi:hypothetical protein